ncbi:MAG: hypothetical protein ACRDPT_07250 [Streptomycetales bacterium]
MYGWIWRHLPGNRTTKLICALLLFAAAVWVLFEHVFPWAEPLLPFTDVTVESGGSAGGSP